MSLLFSLHSLQESSEPTYHLPSDADGNDYEDIPGSSSELDKRTVSNTSANGVFKAGIHNPNSGPPIHSAPPKMHGGSFSFDGARSPVNSPVSSSSPAAEDSSVKYSQVHKMRSREKDEMEKESVSPPPVINAHYVSSNDALAQEIDQLVTDLESSRAIARQW